MKNKDILPGIKLKNENSTFKVIEKFHNLFRPVTFKKSNSKVPSNLPTSCILNGIVDKEIFSNHKFLLLKKVYILFEYDDDLRIAGSREIKDFYINLEPWEDYDFCVFDESYDWCIGVTHNDDVFLVDPKGKFT